MSLYAVGVKGTRFSNVLFRNVIFKSSSQCITLPVLSKLQLCNKSTKREDLGHTTILFEDGTDIQELPVIVRKVSGKDSVVFCENRGDACNNINGNGNDKPKETVVDKVKEEEEVNEIVEGINRCYTARGIFALLETMPSDEVTPYIALQALKKIITVENNKKFRNRLLKSDDDVHPNETFTRTAVLNQLIDKIASSNNSEIILSALKLVGRDMLGSDCEAYKSKLCTEVLCQVTDGNFSITQTCEAIKTFSSFGKPNADDIDKLWVGLSEKSMDIDDTNILDVFRCLPYLKSSQKMVLNMLEKNTVKVWWKIPGCDVAEILCILQEIKASSMRILNILARWINTNIHMVSEDDLQEIVNGFLALGFSNTGIEKALERYVKAKGVKIKNPVVIANIMDYSTKFHFRSVHLLQGAAEYLITHGNSLSPVVLKSLFLPLGYLRYQPTNSFKFWQVLESSFEEKFIQFRPEDVIDMLLTCVYLEKYPLNFVQKVFNPYFLDRLHSCQNKELLIKMRSKLKILDTAMTLECDHYRGPLLPKDHSAKSLWQDGRIRRILINIRDQLNKAAGGEDRVSYSVMLPQLPASELYLIDALLHPSSIGVAMWHLNLLKDHNLHVAVLIHLPEHYAGDVLIGPQDMRKRHFRRIGLKVVGLNYQMLAKLRVHPVELFSYIEQRFKEAEHAY